VAWGTAFLNIPRQLNTTSFRLGALCAFIFALCFAVFLFFTYLTTSKVLVDQIHTRVNDDLNAFMTEATTDGTQTVVQDINERISRTSATTTYYYVSDADNQKLAGNIKSLKNTQGWQEIDFELGSPVTMNPDEDHQIWGQGQILKDGSFIFVGQDAFRVLAAQEAIINSFLWSGGLAILLAVLAGLAVSLSFLSRIDDINKTSLSIIDGHLKYRIPLRGTSDEIDKLSANLNRLFDSNASLMESLKNVSTNIAHDLRTPLSRLRNKLEDAQATAKTPAQFRKHIASALNDSNQMLSTFAALLRIAQIEAGTRKSAFTNLDLSAVFERVANVYQAVAEDEGKIFFAEIEPNISCHGDSELLLLLIVNLVENAIRHTPPKTTITLSLHRAQSARATVSDNGPGIASDLHEKVFERFGRLEESRTTPGNGLGLALVAAIAELHHTKIILSDNHPGLIATFSLPTV
jgi:signal transduction histidine kinase